MFIRNSPSAQRFLRRLWVCALISGCLPHLGAQESLDVFYRRETLTPDPQRLTQALEEKSLRLFALQLAQRLHVSGMHPAVNDYLSSGKTKEQLAAVRNLVYQGISSDAQRTRLHRLLTDSDAEVRDVVGEVFRLWGTLEDLEPLRRTVMHERDPFVKSSYMAAGHAILQRQATPLDLQAWRELQRETPFEPAYSYVTGFETPGVANNDESRQKATQRVLLKRKLAGYPDLDEPQKQEAETEVTPATVFYPPVAGYFHKKRESYGLKVGSTGNAFANSIHIGDDCAWRKPATTVVAITSGRVVDALEGAYSWGGLVVIEHTLPGGKNFCSLYAHLGPALTVRPGDRVEAGQKLGSLGRTHTWEGGGYVCHLHFSIYEGPYAGEGMRPGSWITGYLKPETFQKGEHGWVDPVVFLKRTVSASLQR